MPGRSTCAESSVDCGSATRTPAQAHLLASGGGSGRGRRCSPPIPRSTRRPATVSAPSAVSWPDLLALLALPRLQRPDHGRAGSRRGRARRAARRGRAAIDDESRMTATTKYEAIAPASRAVMSNAPPARMRVVRDGGDDLARRQARPDRRAGRAPRGARRPGPSGSAACSQLLTATRCAERPGHGLDDAEPEQSTPPTRAVPALSPVADAVVDRAAEGVRQQRLREHPDDPEDHPEQRACRAAGARPRPGSASGSGCRASPDR